MMSGYKLIEFGGSRYAFLPLIGKFIGVSAPAYAYLRLRERLDAAAAAAEFRRTEPGAAAVLDEVARLEEAGFFAEPDPQGIDDEAFERVLERRYSGPWRAIELAVSERCNLACRYCYCGTCRDEVPDAGLMPLETARQAVEWLFANSGTNDVNITFFGGEPLLNKPVIRETVALGQRFASERGVKAGYTMTTNGTLLDDESIDLIRRHDFGLMVSLDGPRELHDAQCPARDGKGSWELAVAGIRRLMAKRRRVTVRCTMAHPLPNMLGLIRFFDSFGFSRIVLGTVDNSVYPSPCDLTEEDRADMIRQMEREVIPWMLGEVAAGRTPKYDPFAAIEDDQRRPGPDVPPGIRCGACRGTTTVGADGRLYPCHRFVGMDAWAFGHIGDGIDRERCKDFWRKYRACVHGTCRNCWAYSVCRGPCPWEIARADGTFGMRSEGCEAVKHWLALSAFYLEAKRKIEDETKGSRQ